MILTCGVCGHRGEDGKDYNHDCYWVFRERAAKTKWCDTCTSWRHTTPCGRDDCEWDGPSSVPPGTGDTWSAPLRTMPRMTKKRAYSREFTPRTERRVQMVIDRIPPTLYAAVKAKAKREGVSLRSLVLGWLKEWIEGA